MNWGLPDWRNPEAYDPRSKRYDYHNPKIVLAVLAGHGWIVLPKSGPITVRD
jgi:hypothetical protein